MVMSEQKKSTLDSSSSSQVWGQLGADCQSQVIRLMAQLAYNWLMVQFDRTEKEQHDAKPIGRTQNPT
jgi:hypothetical protein